MRGLCLILLAVGVCQAQQPSKCIAPKQFHAKINQVIWGENFLQRYTFVYDALNQRAVLYDELADFQPGKKYFEYLILPKMGVEYKVDLRSGQCSKAPVRPWRDIEIPANGTFEQEIIFGGPGESVTVQEWSDRVELRSHATIILQFSLLNCYPMFELRIMNNELNQTLSTTFYDFVEGIPNPNDFIIPKACAQEKAFSQKHPFTLWP